MPEAAALPHGTGQWGNLYAIGSRGEAVPELLPIVDSKRYDASEVVCYSCQHPDGAARAWILSAVVRLRGTVSPSRG